MAVSGTRRGAGTIPPPIKSEATGPVRKIWKGGLPRAILFDLDGTLVLAAPNSMVRHAPVPSPLKRVGRAIGKGPAARWAQFRLIGSAENPVLAPYLGRLEAADGASDLLHFLSEQGVQRAITSNNHRPIIEASLDRASLSDYFEVIENPVGPNRGRKPEPDMILRALEALGVSPDDAMLVGNDPIDDRGAAAAAGVFYVGVGVDGDLRVQSLSELQRWLEAQVRESDPR